MPELPEVETTVRDLQKVLIDRTFVDIWTDVQKFAKLKKEIKGKKIKKIWRRGKNIIFDLFDDYSLLVHQKMTGHFLYDNWNKEDRYNSYIHLKFFLDNGRVLAFSDLRKFAKVKLQKTQVLIKELSSLGPEPLEKEFTFNKFKEVLKNKKGKVKQVLMKQEVIVGIGNIYADEILWETKIHPFKDVSKLTEKQLKNIYQSIKKILRKALKMGGTSTSDYRNIKGEKGTFGKVIKAYRREGEQCYRCKTKIQRKKINNRSTCFCPHCQKI